MNANCNSDCVSLCVLNHRGGTVSAIVSCERDLEEREGRWGWARGVQDAGERDWVSPERRESAV